MLLRTNLVQRIARLEKKIGELRAEVQALRKMGTPPESGAPVAEVLSGPPAFPLGQAPKTELERLDEMYALYSASQAEEAKRPRLSLVRHGCDSRGRGDPYQLLTGRLTPAAEIYDAAVRQLERETD